MSDADSILGYLGTLIDEIRGLRADLTYLLKPQVEYTTGPLPRDINNVVSDAKRIETREQPLPSFIRRQQ